MFVSLDIAVGRLTFLLQGSRWSIIRFSYFSCYLALFNLEQWSLPSLDIFYRPNDIYGRCITNISYLKGNIWCDGDVRVCSGLQLCLVAPLISTYLHWLRLDCVCTTCCILSCWLSACANCVQSSPTKTTEASTQHQMNWWLGSLKPLPRFLSLSTTPPSSFGVKTWSSWVCGYASHFLTERAPATVQCSGAAD